MHNQYLGSATLVYAAASGAQNCIKTYNGAQLDDRVMKIEYASPPVTVVQPVKTIGKGLQIQKAPKTVPGIRKGINKIRKNKPGGGANAGAAKKKGGKTLNLMGSTRRDQATAGGGGRRSRNRRRNP